MLRNSAVVSISLQPEILSILEKLAKESSKTRSEVIRDILVSYNNEQSWNMIFAWGRKTKEKYNIKSEDDILRIIND